MDAAETARAAANLRIALEMHDLGVALYAQNLRRASPEASEAEISAAVVRWLRGSPAEHVGA